MILFDLSTQMQMHLPISQILFEFTSDLEFIEWFEVNQNCNNICSLNQTWHACGSKSSNIHRPVSNFYFENHQKILNAPKISRIFKIAPPYVNISFLKESANNGTWLSYLAPLLLKGLLQTPFLINETERTLPIY